MSSLQAALDSPVPAAVVYPVSHAAGMSVIRALAGHCPIVAVDHDPSSAGLRSRCVTPLVAPDLRGSVGFARAMLRVGAQFEVRPVLFLVDDDDVFLSLQQRDEFESVYRLPSSGWDVVEPMVDKAQLYHRAAKAGFAVPRPQAEAGFPCIVKPAYSTEFRQRFGVKAIRCYDKGELLGVLKAVGTIPVVVQEYIPGPASELYTFAAYSGGGGHIIASFTGRKLHQWPEDFGTARLAESVYYPELARVGCELLRHWDYRGISLTEFKRDISGQLRLIEVNVRPGGWPERLAQVCGANLVLAAYRDTVGLPTPRHQRATRFGLKWANAMEDVYYYPKDWRRLWGATDAFFTWRDPLPFFVRLRGWLRARKA